MRTWCGSISNSVKTSLILWPGVVVNTHTQSWNGVRFSEGGNMAPDVRISSHLLGRVVVWKVRAGQLSLGGGDLVLAAALLAVVLVVVQDEA